MRITPKGLIVWDSTGDLYDHDDLAANWDLIDGLFGTLPQGVEILAALPTTGNFAGRMIMISSAAGGFAQWSLLRFDGSAWRSMGYDLLSALPTNGNYGGRLVMLSAANGGFSQWDLVKYDGTTWTLAGVWNRVTTGGAGTNITGVSFANDVYVTSSARGFVLVDRTTGTKYRLYINNGGLATEVVT
jgi:hypothetical protein